REGTEKHTHLPLFSAPCPARGPPRAPRCFVTGPKRSEPPPPPPRHCEIEEHEAVDDSQLTRVQERKEAPRRVRYKVCDGHVACQDERDRTCEQAEHDQRPADELNHTVDAGERHGGHSLERETGKLKYFDVPSSRNSRPTMMRKILNTRGDHVARKLSIAGIVISPMDVLRRAKPPSNSAVIA